MGKKGDQWAKLPTSFSKKTELINVKKDTEDSMLEDLDDKKYTKFIKKTYQIIKKIDDLGLPAINEQVRLITFRPFNAVHFLKYIADKEGVDSVLLAIYSINAEAAKFLNEIINKAEVSKCVILMSNLRNKAHREKEQITRDMFVENERVDLFFCSSHAKIMSIKTKAGNYYTVEGSGNLSYNSRVEQYILDNDKELYDFTENWMVEIKEYLKGKKELVET